VKRQDLTVREAAAELRVSRHTVRRLIKIGALHAIRYGGQIGYRVPPEAIEAFRQKGVAA
jgi:excisionase family DNA binding protein